MAKTAQMPESSPPARLVGPQMDPSRSSERSLRVGQRPGAFCDPVDDHGEIGG